MGAQLIFGLAMLAQVSTTPPQPTSAPPPKMPEVVRVTAPTGQCDARPYQRLVGRTVSDLLTARLPPNTRVYRLDDPPAVQVQAGRLSVELGRSTRVRRVYCS